ncbi:hypothetical protein BJQ90_03627 [Arthrobacter sp. SO3]|nr:hypothetical protein [Arthrobacter sp. SO3]
MAGLAEQPGGRTAPHRTGGDYGSRILVLPSAPPRPGRPSRFKWSIVGGRRSPVAGSLGRWVRGVEARWLGGSVARGAGRPENLWLARLDPDSTRLNDPPDIAAFSLRLDLSGRDPSASFPGHSGSGCGVTRCSPRALEMRQSRCGRVAPDCACWGFAQAVDKAVDITVDNFVDYFAASALRPPDLNGHPCSQHTGRPCPGTGEHAVSRETIRRFEQ